MNSSRVLSRITLRHLSRLQQWAVLLAGSVVCMAVFNALHLPAAFLLGAMLAAICVALAEGAPQPAPAAYIGAQGVVGCLVASSFTPGILNVLRQDWAMFLGVTLMILMLCMAVGWMIARRQIMPGSTAIWGASPGGATIMTLMADKHGGDMRMVAVMQYSRVVIVTAVATGCAHVWAGVSGVPPAVPVWFPPLHAHALLPTLAVALGGAWVASRLRLPGGPLVWPMLLAGFLQMAGYIHIELPLWILLPTYSMLGWVIGLRFSRQAIIDAWRVLPAVIASIFVLIALCAALGMLLSNLMGVDPLTAFLATSPGGVDAVAIIASGSGADVPFVMAFQVARLFAVMLAGPALAQFATRRLKRVG